MLTYFEMVGLCLQQAVPPAPFVSSMTSCGKWSMGKVINVYCHCAKPGDEYLGRVMLGLNSLKPSLKVLSLFKIENPLQNPSVWETMNLMYGQI